MRNSATGTDADNSAYTTGYGQGSTRDAVTFKYDSLGTLQWTSSYDHGSTDESYDIVIDASKNVYICGMSYDNTSDFDYFVIKYDAAGVQQWVYRYDGSGGNGEDKAVAICLSHDQTKVYVTGTSYSSSGGKDITTLCLKTAGGLFWNKDFDGGGNGDDYGNHIAISDDDAIVYVTGSRFESSDDVALLAYDAITGTLLWDQKLDGFAGSIDRGNVLAADGNNVLVAGMVDNGSTSYDYVTAQFDAAGNLNWDNYYDYNNDFNEATGIVRDTTGNIVVVGVGYNGSTYEYHTLMYSNGGSHLWTHMEDTDLPSMNTSPKIAMDTLLDHFYICGERLNSTNDVLVYQIDPSGTKRWQKTIDGAVNGLDAGVGIAVSGYGTIYLAANTENSNSDYDITTIKVSQTPVYIPVNYNLQTDTFSFSHLFYPNTGEILDTAGNAAAEVQYYTKFTFPAQYILQNKVAFVEFKHDTIGGLNSDTLSRVDMSIVGANPLSEIYPVDIRNEGYLNYFMSHTGSLGKTNVKGASSVFVPNIYPYIDLHYTSNAIGAKYFFVVKPGGVPSRINLKFDGAVSTATVSDKLSITSTLGSWEFMKPDIYNIALNFTTMALYTPTVTGTNGWTQLGTDLYGFNVGTYNGAWPLVIEFDMGKMTAPPSSSLNCQWSTYVGGTGLDVPSQTRSDAANNLFVSGWTSSYDFPPAGISVYQNINKGLRDGFIEKYDVNGARIWSTYVGGEQDDYINDFSIAPNGDIYMAGITQSTLLTTAKAGASNSLTPLGSDDIFILQVSPNSSVKKWLTYYGGNSAEVSVKCKFDPLGNFFLIGETYSKNIPIVGTVPQYTSTNNDVGSLTNGFIVKYNTASLINWATYLGTSVNGALTSQADGLSDLDFDASNNDLYVVGWANGTDFPNVVNGNSFNASHVASVMNDGTIAHFSNNGQMKWASYVGGTDYNALSAVRVKFNKVYVGGFKTPGNFVQYPYKNSGNWYFSKDSTSGASDAMFAVFDATKDSLLHYSGIKDTLYSSLEDLEVDNAGVIFVSGATNGSVFPTPLAQTSGVYIDTYKAAMDYFVYAIPPGTTAITWATNFGGSSTDGMTLFAGGTLIDINAANMLHLSGNTSSPVNFPLFTGTVGTTYFDGSHNGNIDVSITRFFLSPINFVGIKENMSKIGMVSLFPNPTQSVINIRLSSAEKTQYVIYNTLGQAVKQGFLNPTTEINSIDVTALSQGMYILDLIQSGQRSSAKFIKNE